jgi:hypothetical protein
MFAIFQEFPSTSIPLAFIDLNTPELEVLAHICIFVDESGVMWSKGTKSN